MVRVTSAEIFECELGSVYHISYHSPPKLKEIAEKIGKEKDACSKAKLFPFISHYLTTGDLIYPAHEGEERVSELLHELGRLNLIQHLFPKQKPGKSNYFGMFRSAPKNCAKNDSSTKLRVKTKKEKWQVVSKAFFKFLGLPDDSNFKPNQVYRPPQQSKGSTLVVVKSSLQGYSDIKVHGPSRVLESAISNPVSSTTRSTHHHINCQVIPPSNSASSTIGFLEELGFYITVRSSWVDSRTRANLTQWVLYRKGANRKISIGTTPRKNGTVGKSSSYSRRKHSTSSRKKGLRNGTTTRRRRTFPFPIENSKENKLGSSSSLSSYSDTEDRVKSMDRLDQDYYDLKPVPGSPPKDTATSNGLSSQNSTSMKILTIKEINEERKKIIEDDFINLPPIKFDKENRKLSNNFDKENGKLSTHFHRENGMLSREYSKFLTPNNKSLSVTSVVNPSEVNTAAKPIRSPSLWNICSKSSVKKVFKIIF